MDQTRGWIECIATTQFPSWSYVLRFCIRWAGCWMLGYSNRYAEIIVSQERLRQKYPIRKGLAIGNDVYACWLSGEGVLPEHKELIKAGAIKELILPDPSSPYLHILRESFGETKEAYDFRGQIVRMTNLALEYKVPTRWFKGVPGVSVTVGNPGRSDAWANLDLIWPGIDPTKRIILRLEGKRDADIISQYRNAITNMFSNAALTLPASKTNES